jgi:hypothetical protein
MTTIREMRDLAQQLLTCEADASNTSETRADVTLRVYENLRLRLGELAGVAGFQSLAARALTLARSEVSSLSAVQVDTDGKLRGMSEIEPSIGTEEDQVYKGGVILISRLLGLLLVFLGEALTMSLVRDIWPDAALDNRDS